MLHDAIRTNNYKEKRVIQMSRIANASKNIRFGYLGILLTLILQFISRTIFIQTIGITYLGVNGLFTNVLSILSFTELGIGTAMNYSLYKPVAENNREKIKSLMYLYKNAYHLIAVIVAVIGLALVPFLSNIIKDPGTISQHELVVFYLIYLFNTVSSYLVSYKYSLVNAEQKNYIQSNIRTITMTVITTCQIIILLVYRNYLFYLIIAAVVELIQKIFVTRYFNIHYPYLLEKNVEKLSVGEMNAIRKNIKALIFHKIGEISVYQTDNLLISFFINVTTVGLVSNYTLIITSITSFISIIFNSTLSGFGNFIATESIEKQYALFKVYRFVGFWLYGFASIALVILLGPFIQVWVGQDMVISNLVLYLIIIDYYIKGHRVVVNNFKTAAGVFDADKYVAILQAIVNLVVSIILVRAIGLPGIYVGTVVQGLISTMTKPIIIYRKIFNKTGIEYYIDSLIYLGILIIPLIILEILKSIIFEQVTINRFFIMLFAVTIIPNFIFIILFRKREEFKYLWGLVLLKYSKRRV